MKEQTLAVQRMQEYVEANLNSEITMTDLSAVSYYSPWYSYRIFKEETGLTPSEYIRKLRLSKTAIKLKNENVKISDVAYDLGFGSVDGYTRAFFREFGCTPHEYAKNPVPITLFVPYGVKYRDILKENRKMEKVSSVFIQITQKPARKVIVKRGIKADNYFDYCGEVGCDVWGILTSMDSLCGEPVCLWLPENLIKAGTSRYVQGVEVATDYSGVIPEGFDVIDLPESEYLTFQGEPFAEEDYCRAIENVQSAIEKYNPETIGYKWDDKNPRMQLEPIGTRGYIELLPVVKK